MINVRSWWLRLIQAWHVHNSWTTMVRNPDSTECFKKKFVKQPMDHRCLAQKQASVWATVPVDGYWSKPILFSKPTCWYLHVRSVKSEDHTGRHLDTTYGRNFVRRRKFHRMCTCSGELAKPKHFRGTLRCGNTCKRLLPSRKTRCHEPWRSLVPAAASVEAERVVRHIVGNSFVRPFIWHGYVGRAALIGGSCAHGSWCHCLWSNLGLLLVGQAKSLYGFLGS